MSILIDKSFINSKPDKEIFGSIFLETVQSDDEWINIDRIIDKYNNSGEKGRKLINDMFISITGYQLTTLVNDASGGGY